MKKYCSCAGGYLNKLYSWKIFKLMRNTLLLVFITVLQAYANDTYSQNTKLTLNLNNVTVANVLEEIQNNSEFYFLFNAKLIDVEREVSISMEDKKISEILTSLFSGTGVNYLVYDRQIILTPSDVTTLSAALQQLKITGTVTDKDGVPLPGVNVVVTGTTVGTLTDIAGKYSIEVPPGSKSLTFSFIGMESQKISIGTLTQINVTMIESAIGLDEVVVVGYGTQKKSDLTGSVASVKMEGINTSTSSSIGQLLQGQAAGLQAIQSSAQPGGSVDLLIRGATSVNARTTPLIVIDGFPTAGVSGDANLFYGSGRTDNALNSINPNDIESIEVLKDASSTAIYGARAANGVILITTKRGKEGKLNVNYESSFNIQKFSQKWDMLNAKDYMIQGNRILKERWRKQNGIIPYGTIPEVDATVPFTSRYSDADIIEKSKNPTDWLGAISRTGFIQQHNLSLSGGTSMNQYMVSLGYFDQAGIIKNSDFQRITGRMNFDQKIGEYFKVGFSSMIAHNTTGNVPLNGGSGGNSSHGIIQLALTANPTISIRNEDGSYPIDPDNTFIDNPVSILEISDETKFKRELINSYVEFNPLKGLQFKMTMGYDGSNSDRNQYLPKYVNIGAQTGGMASISDNKFDNYLFESYGKYTKQMSNHNVTLLVGYSYQQFDNFGSNMVNTDFMFDSFKWYNIGAGQAPKPEIASFGSSSNLISYYSRLNYNFSDKYLLTANFRIDGSSKFAKSNQWGYFPSLSLGWRVSSEQFFQSLKPVFSNLKFRIGYGVTGNDDIGNRTIDAYRVGQNYGFGNQESFGVYADQIGNKNLKWESTKDNNIGIDYGFFDNKINGSFDIYNRITYDLLSWRDLPNYNEITEIPDNIGAIRSKGFELSLFSQVSNNEKFKWNIGFNLSSNEVFWQERAENWKPEIYQKEHDPVRAGYYLVSDGLVKLGETVEYMPGVLPGAIKFKDLNGYKRDENGQPLTDENGRFIYLGAPDGRIDNADKKLIFSSTDPKYIIGLTNNFKYRNFDLGIYMYSFLDYYKLNQTRLAFSLNATSIIEGGNLYNEVKDGWSSDNPNGTRPNIILGLYNTYGNGDYIIENAGFLRLKNIALGYTLPAAKIRGISNLRVFVSIDNIFVLSSYSGIDPEIDKTNAMADYPNQTSYTFGLNLGF